MKFCTQVSYPSKYFRVDELWFWCGYDVCWSIQPRRKHDCNWSKYSLVVLQHHWLSHTIPLLPGKCLGWSLLESCRVKVQFYSLNFSEYARSHGKIWRGKWPCNAFWKSLTITLKLHLHLTNFLCSLFPMHPGCFDI